eukprot:3813742-Pyramimonas_sp.AAC.1
MKRSVRPPVGSSAENLRHVPSRRRMPDIHSMSNSSSGEPGLARELDDVPLGSGPFGRDSYFVVVHVQ